MSSQDGLFTVPICSAHTKYAMKLLELPAELLAKLEQESPSTLHINSDPTSGFAILSDGDKIYRVQQKNSSNPIMIIQASSVERHEVPHPSMVNVSIVEDTLELLPQEDGQASKKVNKWHERFAKGRTMSKDK